MEEILHSIRDIIADDGTPQKPKAQEKKVAAKETPPPPPPEVKQEAAPEEVLELTDVVGAQAPADAPAAAPGGDVLNEIDAALGAPPAPSQPQAKAPSMPSFSTETAADNTLLGQEASRTATEAMRNLLHSVPESHVNSPVLGGMNKTLEELVVESLRPMLADWLNRNLPTIVQKIVEKEIRKLVPRE